MTEYIAFLAGLAVGAAIMVWAYRPLCRALFLQNAKVEQQQSECSEDVKPPTPWVIGKVRQLEIKGGVVHVDLHGGISFRMTVTSVIDSRITVGSKVVLNPSKILEEVNPN